MLLANTQDQQAKQAQKAKRVRTQRQKAAVKLLAEGGAALHTRQLQLQQRAHLHLQGVDAAGAVRSVASVQRAGPP
jgi:hypothetical protein